MKSSQSTRLSDADSDAHVVRSSVIFVNPSNTFNVTTGHEAYDCIVITSSANSETNLFGHGMVQRVAGRSGEKNS